VAKLRPYIYRSDLSSEDYFGVFTGPAGFGGSFTSRPLSFVISSATARSS
jgi:hypothetical protein